MSVAPPELEAALADRYRFERRLGQGGMATVYLVTDLKHRRPVALKVLSPSVAAALGSERFLREIELAARLQHPHIVTVFDSGDAFGTLWFTMPFVEGESLRARLAREGQLPLGLALRIAAEAARALDYAHRQGVLHRDVKPENLLITSEGATMVADFGIARSGDQAEGLTETGLVLGTPAYMSPEQATGERNLDRRTDVYALGCVLYEMLAGEPPYSGPTPQAILAKRLSGPVPRLTVVREVPAAVERTVARALARSPADRQATAAELAEELERGGAPSPGPGRRWQKLLIGAGFSLVLIVALFAARFGSERSGPVAPTTAGAIATAVIPFADLSEAADQTYFSDGLTDELITALSQIDGLRVAARSSSFRFKGREVDPREIGRQLGVGWLLEGSVRRSGSRIRIAAQLVGTDDGYQRWSDTYDRDLADIFEVQEEIARAIASALEVTLGARASGALGARPTRDLEAHDLYLKGRFAWNQRTSAGMTEAVRYLEQAVARDSGFARAWAALADAYILAIPYSGASRDSLWPMARAAAGRALTIDSTLGEAHTAIAYGTMIYDWDWPAAEASFRRAIAIDPDYPTGRQWYADFLWSRGRLDEALEQMREGQRLDPLSLVITTELAQTFYLRRAYDSAEAQVGEALKLEPNYAHGLYVLGMVQLARQRYSDAIRSLERAHDLGGFQEDLSGALANAYAASGDLSKAAEITAELERRLATGSVGPFALTLAFAGRDLDRAFGYLDRAIDERDMFLPEDFFDPQLDPLRADPRFAARARRMGIQ